MNWKQRLLVEYADLINKRVRVEKELENKRDELISRQLEFMHGYEDVLCQRLVSILEDVEKC